MNKFKVIFYTVIFFNCCFIALFILQVVKKGGSSSLQKASLVEKDHSKTSLEKSDKSKFLTTSLHGLVFSNDDILDNVRYYFKHNAMFKGKVFASGNCLFDGKNTELKFMSTSFFIIKPKSTVTFKNLNLRLKNNAKFYCLDDSSRIVFKNVKFVLEDNLTFSIGSFTVHGLVDLTGSYTFVYNSRKASTISKNSTLRLSGGIRFEIGKNSPIAGPPFYFEGTSAVFDLSDCAFHITQYGMVANSGTFKMGKVVVDSKSTTTSNTLVLGDGVDRRSPRIIFDSKYEFGHNEQYIQMQPNQALKSSYGKIKGNIEKIQKMSPKISKNFQFLEEPKESEESKIPSKDFIEDVYLNYPNYPFYSWPYFKKNLFQFGFNYSWANKGFTSNGSCRNLAAMIFKENNILLKDIFETSKLLKTGYLDAVQSDNGGAGAELKTGNEYHYFYVLADKFLKFNASTAKCNFDISYQHCFERPSISFGANIPIVYRKNKIHMESELSIDETQKLSTYRPRFFEKYKDLEAFFENILKAKNMGYNKCDSQIGFGDITFFANTKIKNKNFESIITGLRAVLPSVYYRDGADKLWNPYLGNGGFFELGGFFALHKKFNNQINPYFFVDFSVPFSARVYRRIPQHLTYDGISPAPGNGVGTNLLLADQEVKYTVKPYNVLDAAIALFADEAISLKVRKGPQILFRLGDTIDEVLWEEGFLDLYYEFRAKGRDYIADSSIDTKIYDISSFKKNTFETENKLSINYSYLLRKYQRFTMGFNYTFYGKNVPNWFEFTLAFNKDF